MRTPRLVAAVATVMLAAGLSACGSDAEQGGAVEAADCTAITDGSADGEKLTVWIMEGTNPDATPFFDAVSKEFEEQTGAELDVQFVPWADAKAKFDKAITGDQTPDVAEVGTTWTGEFAENGALVDLSECVEEADLGDDLVDGLVEAGTTRAGGDEEGLYGMPWYAGIRSIVYRTDVFQEAGVQPPTSWDELVTVGKKLKQANPKMMVLPIPGDSMFSVFPFVWGAGGEIATEGEDGTWQAEIDSPESQEGISFYTDLALKEGFSTPAASTWNEADVSDAFTRGDAAMMIGGSWTPAAVVEANPKLEGKIGAFPIPGKDGGVAPSFLGGSHLDMFTTAENQALAWSFIEMMTTGEFAQRWSEESTYFPGTKSLMEELQNSDDPLVAPFAEQVAEGRSVPVTSAWGDVETEKPVSSMLLSILEKKSDVATASKKAADEMDEVFSDAG